MLDSNPNWSLGIRSRIVSVGNISLSGVSTISRVVTWDTWFNALVKEAVKSNASNVAVPDPWQIKLEVTGSFIDISNVFVNVPLWCGLTIVRTATSYSPADGRKVFLIVMILFATLAAFTSQVKDVGVA